jgi:hypothetical protein
MTRNERRWNELQARWAAGDTLEPDEERARLELARESPLAERELEMMSELRDRGSAAHDETAHTSLYDGVLETVGAKTRLRLVSQHEVPARTPELFAPPSRRATWRWVAFAAAPAIVAAGAFVFTRTSLSHRETTVASVAPAPISAPTRVELVLASGEVRLGDRDVVVGQGPLETGQHVSVGRGRACINVDPSIDVCLDGETEVALDSLLEDDVRIRVVRGTAMAALAPRAPGHTFSLVGGNVSATARGTMFAIEHSPGESTTSVVVVEGKVEVTGAERPATMLSAHTRMTTHGASKETESVWVGRGEESRLLSLISPRDLWQTKEIGTIDIAEGSPGTLASIGQQSPLSLPLRAFVLAGTYHVLFRDPLGNESSVDVDIATGENRHIEPPDLARSLVRGGGASPKESAASLLESARRELARGGAKAALPLYQRLRANYPTSPEAFTVLVTMGQIDLDLRSPARALVAFETYLHRGGPLAPEALAGKIRALRALGRINEERTAIDEYLASYPGGFEAPALKKRVETLSPP